MLDKFLTVAHQKTKEAEARDRQVELLKKLPNDLLFKIASGAEKLSYHCDDGESWVEKFQGSPLLQQAVALRKEELELDMADAQRRKMEDAQRQQFNVSSQESCSQRDELSLKKKMLELQMVEQSAGVEAPVPEMQEPAAQEPAAPAPVKVATASFELARAKLKMAGTKQAFALPALASAGTKALGGLKTLGQTIGQGAKSIGGAAQTGFTRGMAAPGGGVAQGLQRGAVGAGKQFGQFAKTNPGAAAGLVAAPALAAGYAAGGD